MEIANFKLVLSPSEMVMLYGIGSAAAKTKRAKFHALDGNTWAGKSTEVISILGLTSIAHSIRRVTLEITAGQEPSMDIELMPFVAMSIEEENYQPAFQVLK